MNEETAQDLQNQVDSLKKKLESTNMELEASDDDQSIFYMSPKDYVPQSSWQSVKDAFGIK